MASSAASNTRIELQGTGDNAGTWGTKANTVFEILDRVSSGYGSSVAVADGDTTLSVTDYTLATWHHQVWNITGALTTAANLIVPNYGKFWAVRNSTTGSQTLTIKVTGQTGVVIPDGGWAILYNNGTDVVKLVDNDDFTADPAGNGLVARTAAGAAAARTLTGPAAGITVSNGDGVSGNPTLALANDLAAVEGLASNGLAARTATDTWAVRTLTAGGGVAVTNGDGVSGNPTVAVDINGTTTATGAVAPGDYLLLYDVSLGALRKAATSDVVGSAGGVTGPGSSTDNAWARWNGTGGTAVQNGAWVEADTGAVTAGGDLDMDGSSVTGSNNLIEQGKHTIAMPAGAMVPRTTNGAAASSEELATNDVMIAYLAFDAATAEAAQFAIPMPKGWNEGTVTARFFWKHPTTTTNFGVVWGIRANAVSNDDALDASWGTAVTVTDTGGTTGDLYVSDETAALTIGGTPAEDDLVIFEVYRVAGDGSDTMAVDAHLIAAHIYYTINAATDA